MNIELLTISLISICYFIKNVDGYYYYYPSCESCCFCVKSYYYPVCASNGKKYNNICEFNCARTYFLYNEGTVITLTQIPCYESPQSNDQQVANNQPDGQQQNLDNWYFKHPKIKVNYTYYYSYGSNEDKTSKNTTTPFTDSTNSDDENDTEENSKESSDEKDSEESSDEENSDEEENSTKSDTTISTSTETTTEKKATPEVIITTLESLTTPTEASEEETTESSEEQTTPESSEEETTTAESSEEETTTSEASEEESTTTKEETTTAETSEEETTTSSAIEEDEETSTDKATTRQDSKKTTKQDTTPKSTVEDSSSSIISVHPSTEELFPSTEESSSTSNEATTSAIDSSSTKPTTVASGRRVLFKSPIKSSLETSTPLDDEIYYKKLKRKKEKDICKHDDDLTKALMDNLRHLKKIKPKNNKDDDLPACETCCPCPKTAKLPVCASNGEVYDNICLFECASSYLASKREYIAIAKVPCYKENKKKAKGDKKRVTAANDNGLQCPCTKEIDLICASNGETYKNKCLFSCTEKFLWETKKEKITIRRKGSCDSKKRNKNEEVQACICPEINNPVCGSNGKKYKNLCNLDCDRKIEQKKHFILKEVPCSETDMDAHQCKCPKQYFPVCASNGKIYPNKCMFGCHKDYLKTRGIEIKIEKSPCFEEASRDKEQERILRKIFTNKKEKASKNRTGDKDLKQSNKNNLTSCLETPSKNSKQQSASLRKLDEKKDDVPSCESCCECPTTIKPVCAVDGAFFPNECLFNCAKRFYKSKGLDLKEGTCPNVPKTRLQFCDCPLVEKPVCASNGITYKNKCFYECKKKEEEAMGRTLNISQKGCKKRAIQRQPELKTWSYLNPKSKCNCPKDYEPVFDQYGIKYNNLCIFNCNKNNIFKADKKYLVLKKCPENKQNPTNSKRQNKPSKKTIVISSCRCPNIYYPVCASDGKTYFNECHFECTRRTSRENGAEQELTKVPCFKKRNERYSDLVEEWIYGCTCPKVFHPVCASNGQRYPNMCIYQCARKHIANKTGVVIKAIKYPCFADKTNTKRSHRPIHEHPNSLEDNKSNNNSHEDDQNTTEHPISKEIKDKRTLVKPETKEKTETTTEGRQKSSTTENSPEKEAESSEEKEDNLGTTTEPEENYEESTEQVIDPVKHSKNHTEDHTTPKGCPDCCLCSAKYYPVCSSDGETYPNKCAFECSKQYLKKNGKDIHIIKEPCYPKGIKETPNANNSFVKQPEEAYAAKGKKKNVPDEGNNQSSDEEEREIAIPLDEEKNPTTSVVTKKRETKQTAPAMLTTNVARKKIRLSTETTKKSKCKCNDSYFPVCATNNIKYYSYCDFDCDRVKMKERGINIIEISCTKLKEKEEKRKLQEDTDIILPFKRKIDKNIPPCESCCTCGRDYDPICATNGKTYDNLCLFDCAKRFIQANKGTKLRIEKCPKETSNDKKPFTKKTRIIETATQKQCERNCPQVEYPVCASDSKKYKNPCYFNCARQVYKERGEHLLVVKIPCVSPREHHDSYEDASLEKEHHNDCEECCPCPMIHLPVCASNGKKYRNGCVFDCAKKYLKQKNGELIKIRNCPTENIKFKKLKKLLDRVKTKLTKQKEKDVHNISKIKVARVKPKPVCEDCCECPDVSYPVCASNGKKYQNDCYFECAKNYFIHKEQKIIARIEMPCFEQKTRKIINKTNDNDYYSEASNHVEEPKETGEQDCPKKCGNKYFPLCASNGVRYASPCHFECAKKYLNKIYGTRINVTTIPCYPSNKKKSKAVEKTKPFCNCPRTYLPVCASNGLRYSNLCQFHCDKKYLEKKGENIEVLKIPCYPSSRHPEKDLIIKMEKTKMDENSLQDLKEKVGFSDKNLSKLPSSFSSKEEKFGNKEKLDTNEDSEEGSHFQKERVEPDTTKRLVPEENCHDCSKLYWPVCASNGKKYSNPCTYECNKKLLKKKGITIKITKLPCFSSSDVSDEDSQEVTSAKPQARMQKLKKKKKRRTKSKKTKKRNLSEDCTCPTSKNISKKHMIRASNGVVYPSRCHFNCAKKKFEAWNGKLSKTKCTNLPKMKQVQAKKRSQNFKPNFRIVEYEKVGENGDHSEADDGF